MLNIYFPERDFKALLFDFDGTVADTMPAHLDAWNRALSAYNLSLTREQHESWAGRPTRMIIELLNEMHKVQIPTEEFLKKKEMHYFSAIGEVQEIVSVVEIIKYYHGKVPLAVVTGSRHKPVEATLAHLKLTQYFDILVCAEDYKNGKPAPDCFLLAANLLKVKPQDCLVFEDSVLGISAALNAGMPCVKVDVNYALSAVKS